MKCALEEVHDLYGFETNAIVTMEEVIEHLYNREYKGKVIIDDELKASIDAYYAQYGARKTPFGERMFRRNEVERKNL